MKTFYALFTALLLSTAITSASYAESGFGSGFTGDSPTALTDTVVTDEQMGMDDAAAMFNETEPAAGDETTEEPMAPMLEATTQIVPEGNVSEDSVDNVIIKSIHQE